MANAMSGKLFLIAGALFGFCGVVFGAFGAHALKTKLSESMFLVFEVGVRYQMYHAVVLLVLGLLCLHFNQVWFSLSGWFFIFGIFIFSGSLYVLALSGIKIWGAVTPIGGLSLLAGWLLLIFSFCRN